MRVRTLCGLVILLLMSAGEPASLRADGDPPRDHGIQYLESLEKTIQMLKERGLHDQALRTQEVLERARLKYLEFRMTEERNRQTRERAEQSVLAEKERPAEPHRQELEQRIHHLRVAADHLHAIGHHEQGEKLQQQAREIERELQGHHGPEHPPGHLPALEQLEAMRHELRQVKGELEGLRAEVRMLRETLLRLPAPAFERRPNPPVMPAPPTIPPAGPAPVLPPVSRSEGATIPPVKPRSEDSPRMTISSMSPHDAVFRQLDRNNDQVLTVEELGPLSRMWQQAGLELEPGATLSVEQFADRMSQFVKSRTRSAVTSSRTNTAPERQPESRAASRRPPSEKDLLILRAENLFRTLDRNSDGKVNGEEWNHSRSVRSKFERADVNLAEPISQERFVELYVKLEQRSESRERGQDSPDKSDQDRAPESDSREPGKN